MTYQSGIYPDVGSSDIGERWCRKFEQSVEHAKTDSALIRESVMISRPDIGGASSTDDQDQSLVQGKGRLKVVRGTDRCAVVSLHGKVIIQAMCNQSLDGKMSRICGKFVPQKYPRQHQMII